MTFQLTKGQAEGLEMAKKIASTHIGRPAIGVLAGYAGVGKSTLIAEVAREIGEVVVITPTGKAALRVTEATGLPALTLHRWQYKPHEDPSNGGVFFSLRAAEEIHKPSSNLVVIDEASMVNAETWEDIHQVCSLIGCNILCVGDPFQLPPVTNSKEYFSLLDPGFNYDMRVELTEIVRQALDNPIIKSSMQVRNGKSMDAIFSIPRVLDRDFLNKCNETISSGGVVVCHTNAMRHLLNEKIRKSKGYSDAIQSGEPLLVLKNNYKINRYNGEIIKFEGWQSLGDREYEIYDNWKNLTQKGHFGRTEVEHDEVIMSPEAIHGKLENLTLKSIEKVAQYQCGRHLSYLHCNFGYTLSLHRAQGSEWKNVLVVLEKSINVETRDGKKFLYTALTRAKENVCISWNPKLGD